MMLRSDDFLREIIVTVLFETAFAAGCGVSVGDRVRFTKVPQSSSVTNSSEGGSCKGKKPKPQKVQPNVKNVKKEKRDGDEDELQWTKHPCFDEIVLLAKKKVAMVGCKNVKDGRQGNTFPPFRMRDEHDLSVIDDCYSSFKNRFKHKAAVELSLGGTCLVFALKHFP